METIQYWENGNVFDNNGKFLGTHELDLARFELESEDQGNYAEFNELEYAVEFGDVVYVPGEDMHVLRYTWNGEEKQIFCQKATRDAVKEGFEELDGSLPEGVEKGEYWIVDGYNHWYDAEAYWQPNKDTLSPYREEDFNLKEGAGFISRWN